MFQLPINFNPLTITSRINTSRSGQEIQALKKIVAINEKRLNCGQKNIYNKILEEIKKPTHRIHFIDGPGVSFALFNLKKSPAFTYTTFNLIRGQEKHFFITHYWLKLDLKTESHWL